MKWYDGFVKVVDIQEETYDTKRFFVELIDIEDEDDTKLEFIPGQFVELVFPIDENIKKCSRHYSISSSPEDSRLEFIINKVNGGAGTEYLFSDKVIIGQTKWRMIAPLGQFILPKSINNDICFICTGTGLGPFRSMITEIFKNKKIDIIDKKITLIFGCREEKNILYYKELKLLEEINPNFNYYISLSREKTNKHTNGYVQDILNELHKNNNFKNVDFFICGTGNMVNSVKQNLFDKGFNKENIHLEIYV
jgi:ferredoxin-NADP reductase